MRGDKESHKRQLPRGSGLRCCMKAAGGVLGAPAGAALGTSGGCSLQECSPPGKKISGQGGPLVRAVQELNLASVVGLRVLCTLRIHGRSVMCLVTFRGNPGSSQTQPTLPPARQPMASRGRSAQSCEWLGAGSAGGWAGRCQL